MIKQIINLIKYYLKYFVLKNQEINYNLSTYIRMSFITCIIELYNRFIICLILL